MVQKRVTCCPVLGSSLDSPIVNEGKGHSLASCDVAHMSSGFNVVNTCEQGVNVASVTVGSANALHVKNNVDYEDNDVKYVTKCFYRWIQCGCMLPWKC